MKQFDHSRADLAPYGFTCELWIPRRMRRPDRHNEIELNFLSSGSLTYLRDGEKVTLQSERLTVFWAAIPHQIIDFEGDEPYLVATIPLAWILQWSLPERLMRRILDGKVIKEPQTRRSRLDISLFHSWLQEMENPSPDQIRIVQLELEARLRRMALNLGDIQFRQRTRDTAIQGNPLSKVEKMAGFIARICNHPLKIKEISQVAGLHPDYASNLFRKTLGTTLNQYLTQHRISMAQRLLLTTKNKIGEVARESGFKSLSRFNTAFKEECGCTPREYRNSRKGI